VCATVAADALAMGIDKLGPLGNGAGFVAVRCPNLGRKVSPEEISGLILRKLIDQASRALWEARRTKAGTGTESGLESGTESESEAGTDQAYLIKKAVITVPAYFDDNQCDATIRAGMRAGLETVKLLREPIAAALAYGVDVTGDETVFVFDLGGGTFDVSVLDVGGGTVEVLATGGDNHLGGDDFDRELAVWLAKEAKEFGTVVDPRGALQAARRVSISQLQIQRPFAHTRLTLYFLQSGAGKAKRPKRSVHPDAGQFGRETVAAFVGEDMFRRFKATAHTSRELRHRGWD
jgi:hypothetical protein